MNRQRIEYIWLDGREPLPKMRGKTRFVEKGDLVPDWNFDGGSTNQGSLKDSDRLLRCVRVYTDPFVEEGLIALCEVLYHDGTPHESNSRNALSQQEQGFKEQDPWVGFEQEFTLFNPSNNQPLGFIVNPTEQGPYYCGVGCLDQVGRYLLNEFEVACIKAGVMLEGINAEVMQGQWEFQTSHSDPLRGSDDLWVARYLLERVAELKPIIVSYDPKPHEDFNGAGCHTNVSTKKSRKSFGEADMRELMGHMEADHDKHIKVCGAGIARRMTGTCETSDYEKFTWGIGDRGASIRIPQSVVTKGLGYFEDRRPCANIDPYKVVGSLMDSLNKSKV